MIDGTASGGGVRLETRVEDERPTFDALFRQYRPGLVRYVGNRGAADAEGVADLALLDTFRALDRLRSTEPPVVRAYLYKAARSHLARDRSSGREVPVAPGDELTTIDDGFEAQLAASLDMDELLDALPPNQRDVLRLRFFEHLTHDEAAEVLGKQPNAVRQLQHRGLRRLRRLVYATLILAMVAAAVAAAVLGGSSGSVDQAPARPSVEQPVVVDDGGEGERPPGVTSTVVDRPGPPAPSPQAPTESDSAPPDGVEGTEGVDGAEDTDREGAPDPLDGASGDPSAPVTTTVEPAPPAGAALYEPFDFEPGSLVGERAIGFEQGTTWTIVGTGSARLSVDATGLAYVDDAGNRLSTVAGALTVDPSGTPMLSRPLAVPYEAGQTYWVAFLVRLDSGGPGDAFWTPDGFWDRGGAGIQQHPRLKFVNGSVTEVAVAEGQTHLVVVRMEPGTASLWVDPRLDDPGQPAVVHLDPMGGPLEEAMLRFNDVGRGIYTVDELRIGDSFAAVAPIG